MPLEVYLDNVVGDDAGAEVDCLLPHEFHELWARCGSFAMVGAFAFVKGGQVVITILRQRGLGELLQGRGLRIGPGGEVLDFGGEIELTERKDTIDAIGLVDRSFVNERLQIGAGGVNGGSPACGAGPDDDDFFGHPSLLTKRKGFAHQYRKGSQMKKAFTFRLASPIGGVSAKRERGLGGDGLGYRLPVVAFGTAEEPQARQTEQ